MVLGFILLIFWLVSMPNIYRVPHGINNKSKENTSQVHGLVLKNSPTVETIICSYL